jgi:DNA invertase Pin-like site-specific DNA recombinase
MFSRVAGPGPSQRKLRLCLSVVADAGWIGMLVEDRAGHPHAVGRHHDPADGAMFGMPGVFSEFEREMIVARVKAGISRANDAIERDGHFISKAGTVTCESA